jgi:DNA-binding winged helix-turn-helix (wHTH) protein
VVSKEELLDNVWGDRFVSESALSSRITSARKAVGDDSRRQEVNRTVHGRGFRIVAPVENLGDRPPEAMRTPTTTRGVPGLSIHPSMRRRIDDALADGDAPQIV